MLKIIVTFISLCAGVLYASSLTLVIDNNASVKYYDEYDSFAQTLTKKQLKSLNIDELYIVNDYEDISSFNIDEEVPTVDEFDSSDLGIGDLLEKIFSLDYIVEGDTIIIFSKMDYTDKSTNTRSTNKMYNDAWITSSRSPIQRIIKQYNNKPLNKVKIIIIDPNKNIKYLVNRERFFSLLFTEVGAELLYYGSLDFDTKRVSDYLVSTKKISTLKYFEPLRNELNLMLDNNIVQYELD